MNNLKQVSRTQYIAAVKSAGDTVRSHLTEGYRYSVAQWLDVESDCVRFQAVYSEGHVTSVIATYYIEDV